MTAGSLQSLKNIGPAMEGWLKEAGITTPQQLQEIGAVEAYLRIRGLHKNAANKMALYALWGAINNENCLWLDPQVKEMLNQILQDAKT